MLIIYNQNNVIAFPAYHVEFFTVGSSMQVWSYYLKAFAGLADIQKPKVLALVPSNMGNIWLP